MKVAIIGYGIDGKSAVHYWQDLGAEVTICGRSPIADPPANVQVQLGQNYLENLGRFDVIVRSSGIPSELILKNNPGVEGRITTVVNEFVRACPTKNIIGITGTKGKGTTATLTTHMLEAAGYKVFLGGNIGVSPFDFMDEISAEDWVVLELSSYQLSDFTGHVPLAACLMMQEEHIPWHGTVEKYVAAKANLFKHQTSADTAIYFADNQLSHDIASNSSGKKIPYFANPGAYVEDGAIMIDGTAICRTDELQLLGKHNWQNACAAATIIWQVAQTPDAIHKVLTTFTGLPHRLEAVRERNNVTYYNDSFASAPPATEAAISAIPGSKVLIIGGYDRHLAIDKLVVTIKEHADDIRSLLLIGESAQRVAEELSRADYTNFKISPATTMEQVVIEAEALAQSGDSVVLSPGFPSFDMFQNFEDRGLQFKKEVNLL